MNSCPCQCKDEIRRQARALGALACGFALAREVEPGAVELYDRWIAAGRHGTMAYCEKYRDVRNDPRLLLDGARTVVSCAFGYDQPAPALPLARRVARYAWGEDYHRAVKQRLQQLGLFMVERWGGAVRVCVDTAPIRERYWAMQAGVGYIGKNNQLVVPGYGSAVFLGEVLWTVETEPDAPCTDGCADCGACMRACPNGALDGLGGCDASRCISYLTIEHRGALPPGGDLRGMLAGCDLCQCRREANVHHENELKHTSQPLHDREDDIHTPVTGLDTDLLSLTEADLAAMTPSHYRRLTRHSALSRIPHAQLLRNLSGGEHGDRGGSGDA